MTEEQKREHAEAIKHALGMSYGPPMEGEEGWAPPRYVGIDPASKGWDMTVVARSKPPIIYVTHHVDCSNIDPDELKKAFRRVMAKHGDTLRNLHQPMTVEDADDEDFDTTAQAIMDELREKKERRMAEELAKQRAKAAEPKPPSDDPWAVIGKAEDDGERIMDITRNFG